MTDYTPCQQFADVMADVVASAVRTAIEHNDGGHMLRPAIDFLREAINENADMAYNFEARAGVMCVYLAPYGADGDDTMFRTKDVKLSDILLRDAECVDDIDAFWASIDSAIAEAKQKVGR